MLSKCSYSYRCYSFINSKFGIKKSWKHCCNKNLFYFCRKKSIRIDLWCTNLKWSHFMNSPERTWLFRIWTQNNFSFFNYPFIRFSEWKFCIVKHPRISSHEILHNMYFNYFMIEFLNGKNVSFYVIAFDHHTSIFMKDYLVISNIILQFCAIWNQFL